MHYSIIRIPNSIFFNNICTIICNFAYLPLYKRRRLTHFASIRARFFMKTAFLWHGWDLRLAYYNDFYHNF